MWMGKRRARRKSMVAWFGGRIEPGRAEGLGEKGAWKSQNTKEGAWTSESMVAGDGGASMMRGTDNKAANVARSLQAAAVELAHKTRRTGIRRQTAMGAWVRHAVAVVRVDMMMGN